MNSTGPQGGALDPRLHFVVATAIVVKPRTGPAGSGTGTGQGRRFEYLIAKRAPHETAFPNKWTVPGGKLVTHEYQHLPKKFGFPQWYRVVDWVLRKEVREEVGLEIGTPRFVTDLVFIRPDGYPVVTLSFWAPYQSGEVKLCKDLTEYSWVTLEEAKGYDLIEGIWDEIRLVDERLRTIERY